MTINTEAVQARRKKGWAKLWPADKVLQVWDEKIEQQAWLVEPAYRLVTDACIGCASVLDVGCGGGVQYAAFREFAPNVAYTGIDIHASMVAYAREAFPGVQFDEGDAMSLPYENGQFDGAIIRQVIEHYKPPWVRLLLAEAVRVTQNTLVILNRAVTEDIEGIVTLGNRGGADWNHYGRRWLAWAIEEAVGGKVDIEIHDIPWFEGSPAQGDQDVWIARW